MEELMRAIWVYWLSDSCADCRTLVPGKMWAMTAHPSNPDDAYIRYQFVGNIIEESNTGIINYQNIDFGIYVPEESNENNESGELLVMKIRDAFVAAFDNVDLTLGDDDDGDDDPQRLIRMHRDSEIGPVPDPDEGFNQHMIYEVIYG